MVKGITERLEPTDYVLNLLVSSSDPRHKTRRYLGGGTVDGALVVSHHAGDRDLIVLSDIVPTVFGGDPTTMLGLRERYYVDVDNVGGAQQATRHLIRLGTPTDRHGDRSDGHACRGAPVDGLASGDGRRRAWTTAQSPTATSPATAGLLRCASCWRAAPISTPCSWRTT